ncbi:MAG: DUF1598 domain-containing protein [Pirellulaceae bacterium]
MTSGRSVYTRTYKLGLGLALVALGLILTPVISQAGRFQQNRAVGGISIDAAGVVQPAALADQANLVTLLRKQLKEAPEGLVVPAGMRMISLRGLEEALEASIRNNQGALPDELRYMAGLQRIEYVFVVPERNDIVLAGPGEGWRVDDQGNIVGITTGRPVLRLDDFMAALRAVQEARRGGISVSIDPTEKGYQQLQTLLAEQRRSRRTPQLATLEPAMRKAFGNQQIKILGVPTTSHFARVMVAADYKMKRLAMKLDPSPVKGLTSFVDMVKNARNIPPDVNPRWWLACNYEPLVRSEDSLAWQLRGPGVKAMTEDEFVDDNGRVRSDGSKNPMAQKWADQLTKHYDELSKKDIVFGELRNIMDMCVIAALLEKEQLLERAGCSIPLLTDQESRVKLEAWLTPKVVPPQCSFLKTRRGWVVTASGGVQVESWPVLNKTQMDPQISAYLKKAKPANQAGWWWN